MKYHAVMTQSDFPWDIVLMDKFDTREEAQELLDSYPDDDGWVKWIEEYEDG